MAIATTYGIKTRLCHTLINNASARRVSGVPFQVPSIISTVCGRWIINMVWELQSACATVIIAVIDIETSYARNRLLCLLKDSEQRVTSNATSTGINLSANVSVKCDLMQVCQRHINTQSGPCPRPWQKVDALWHNSVESSCQKSQW